MMKKVNIGKVAIGWALSSVLGTAISFGIIFAEELLIPGVQAEYTKSGIFRSMDDPLMIYMFFHPTFMALCLSVLFALCHCSSTAAGTKDVHHCCTSCGWGGVIGGIVWGLMNLPGFVMMLMTLKLTCAMVASWFIGGLVVVMAEAAVISHVTCHTDKAKEH